MTADLSALIARLEAGPVYLTHKEAYDMAIFFGSDTALGMASLIRKAFAGGSIDAALALAERVLPGWWVELSMKYLPDEPVSMRWLAEVTYPMLHEVVSYGEAIQSREFYSVFAPTPALALCIAILRAKQGEGG